MRYLKAWSFEARDIREIDIACYHQAGRRHAFRQSERNGSVPAAEFQTAAPGTNSQPFHASELKKDREEST